MKFLFKNKKYYRSLIVLGLFFLSSLLISIPLDRYFSSNADAKVRFMIIEKTWIPRAAFVMSALPLALASTYKFGFHSFAIVKAEVDPLLNAFKEAEFIVIGAHGRNGRVYLDDGAVIGPRSSPYNSDIKHVYFGSCYLGEKRELWEQKFPNAEIIAHDELTTPLNGWFYLFFVSWRKLLVL